MKGVCDQNILSSVTISRVSHAILPLCVSANYPSGYPYLIIQIINLPKQAHLH